MKKLYTKTRVISLIMLITSPLAAAQTSLTDSTQPLSATMLGKLNPANKTSKKTAQLIELKIKIDVQKARNIMYRIPQRDANGKIIRYGAPNEIQKQIFSYLEREWTLKKTFKAHHSVDVILSLQISLDGKQIITRSLDSAKVWSATNGNLLHTLNVYYAEPLEISTYLFGPDGENLGGRESNALIQKLPLTIGKKKHIFGATYSPDGKQIITADYKGIKIWDRIPPAPNALEQEMRECQAKVEERKQPKKHNYCCAIQ